MNGNLSPQYPGSTKAREVLANSLFLSDPNAHPRAPRVDVARLCAGIRLALTTARCARGDALGPEPIRYRPAHQALRPVYLRASKLRTLKCGGLDSYGRSLPFSIQL
jgi:hypothetical protein